MRIQQTMILAYALLSACSSSSFSGGNKNQTVAAKAQDATPAEEEPAVSDDIFSGCSKSSNSRPVLGKVYKLPEWTQKLPDFDSLGNSDDIVCLTNYNIPDQDWTIGFPGRPELQAWFALRTTTILNITQAGTYRFFMDSDDGSNLYIDSKQVINHDGPRDFSRSAEAEVYLSAGKHKVVLDWYQGEPTSLGLQLYWKTPSASEFVIVPPSAFSPE